MITLERILAAAAAGVLVVNLHALPRLDGARPDDSPQAAGAVDPAAARTLTDATTATAPPASATVAPTTSPAAEPTPPARPEPPAAAAAPPEPPEPPAVAPQPAIAPWSVGVHSGLGTWIDVYDWSVSHGGPEPSVTLDTIDALAARGVRTIYLQTARITAPDAVLEPERLQGLIDRAHGHGMFVVGWYLPTFVDPADDWRRIEAALALDIDGFALDIESQEVADPAERTRRLLAMSQRLRDLAGDRVLVANVLPPVQLEELAPSLWPGFPWAELGAYYEVFMPMGYFTFREPGHHWRDAEAYTAENVRRVRTRVGDPDLPVHFIGGIADLMTVADVEGMTRGARATGAIGLSLYDAATTGSELWAPMQAWRDLGGR